MNEYEITDEELDKMKASQEIVASITEVIEHLSMIRSNIIDGTEHPLSTLNDIDRLGDSLHMIRTEVEGE